MIRFIIVLMALVLSARTLFGAQFRLPGHTFTLPDGFEIEQVAGPPLVMRPIVGDFDELGRLYVADSSGSNDKVDKQLAEKPHRIVRLEDTNGDGRFDHSVVFADKMMFPEGTMWFDGSLYVAAPPSIWKLTDTDADGVADQRQEWFQGKTLTGCANDLHGPYLGPDGWIYWCKGAFAKQTYELPGKKPFVTRAAHIFRCRPDGTGVEPVMTGGMDNPVDVVFTPEGERIFTTTFFQHPGGGLRDGLIHAVYGGVYGKNHDVIEEHKQTGDVMPVLTHLGPAAPCGLTGYASGAFGEEYRHNLFAALFNLHKVTRHVLHPAGSTYRSVDSDFVVSDNVDFHPTDVLEDADGTLLIIDTGGWYKLCCPTSQLWKPDVLGAIYRVRRRGVPPAIDPRGTGIDWTRLKPEDESRFLGDARPAVRRRAIERLARHGAAALPALKAALRPGSSILRKPAGTPGPAAWDPIEARRNAVWTLTRIDQVSARAAVRGALSDPDPSVRQVAIHAVSLSRDAAALGRLLEMLRSETPALQRNAAMALGRLGDKQAVPALLSVAGAEHDRPLEHALTYALIEIADRASTAAGLSGQSPFTRRTALIALDQMDDGGLGPETVARLMTAAEPVVKQAAWWIAGRHADWGQPLSSFFRERLAAADVPESERGELERLLARMAHDPGTQEFLASLSTDAAAPNPLRLLALRAMELARLKEIPAPWSSALPQLLRTDDPEILRHAIAAARSFPPPKDGSPELRHALLEVASRPTLTEEARLEALTAVPGGVRQIEPALFELLIASIASEKPVRVRSAAAATLAKAKLDREQLLAVIRLLKDAGPLELPALLGAFENGGDQETGFKLIEALAQSPAAAALRPELLRPRLAKFPAAVQNRGDELLDSLNLDAAEQKKRLEQLMAELKDGDVRRGQTVFNGVKAACSSCHAIGYLGGNLGPDLTRIGQVRTERDLLEAILFPNASFVRSYEPVRVVTRTGDDHSGVLRRDAADEVVLGTGPNLEIRISRQDIAEMQPGSVSVMPGGLEEQLSRQELADLLAFLKATKW